MSARSANLIRFLSDVRVAVDRGEYSIGDKIVVTVANNLDQPLEIGTQRTNCSILWIERFADGLWQRLRNCTDLSPAVEMHMEAKKQLTQTIDTGYTYGGPSFFPEGIYRASLHFTAGELTEGYYIGIATSTVFRIK